MADVGLARWCLGGTDLGDSCAGYGDGDGDPDQRRRTCGADEDCGDGGVGVDRGWLGAAAVEGERLRKRRWTIGGGRRAEARWERRERSRKEMGVRGNREITDEEITRGGRWERRDGEEIAIGVRQRSGWRGGGAASGFWGQRHGGGGGVRVRERRVLVFVEDGGSGMQRMKIQQDIRFFNCTDAFPKRRCQHDDTCNRQRNMLEHKSATHPSNSIL
uniref:Uncharacterized protein n=1 Tax=Oryza barthii TaxID=65489 RepID=A0A0D3FNX3_9ORYZ